MLYLSSSCSSKRGICEALRELIDFGARNIELSGNLLLHDGWEEDLVFLKKEYNLNFLIHNYFPPLPKSPDFVLNLAAREKNERDNTFRVIKRAIFLLKSFGSNLYTLHPGFDTTLYEKEGEFYRKEDSVKKKNTKKDFYKGIDSLLNLCTEEGFKSGIENVFRLKDGEFRSFMETKGDIFEFLDFYRKEEKIGLLLDFGHLNIAANYFGFDKYSFLEKLFSEYADKIFEVHISENDGARDLHNISDVDSWQIDMVCKNKFLCAVPIIFEWRGFSTSTVFKRFTVLKGMIEKKWQDA